MTSISDQPIPPSGLADPRASDPRRHFSALLSGQLINKGFRFLAFAILARALTPADFGLLNVGVAVSGVVVIATTLGLPEIGARQVAIDRGRAPWLLSRVVGARVGLVGVAGLVALAVVAVAWPQRLGFVVAVAAMSLVMAASLDWLARGLERMQLAGAADSAGGAAMCLGAVLLATGSPSLTAAMLVFFAAEVVGVVVYWVSLRREFPRRPALGGVSGLLRGAWPVGIASVAVYSYTANLDTVILAATRSAAEAGLYSGAYRLFLTFNMVAIFAAYATFPTLSRSSHRELSEEAVQTRRNTAAALTAYGLAVVAFAELAGGPVLRLLFGAEFGAMATTFVVLSVAVSWYAIGYPAGYSLIAADRNRRFLWGAGVAGVVSLGLDFALIPSLGASGAALATLCGFVGAACVWLGSHDHAWRTYGRTALPILLASVGGLVAAVVPELRLTIGLGTVGLLCLVTVVWLISERRQ